MIPAQSMVDMFDHNVKLTQRELAGLSHTDSLIQPQCGGNCLNWILGHMVSDRDTLLRVLGEPPIMTDAQNKRYAYNSEPVLRDGDGAVQMETLLEMFEQSQPGIEKGLKRLTDADLAKEARFAGRVATFADKMLFEFWHESYHVGQTEQMRQIAGQNDKIW